MQVLNPKDNPRNMRNMSQEIHEYPWDMDSQNKGIQELTNLSQPSHFVVEQQQHKDLENLKNSDTRNNKFKKDNMR